jgi:hypothetical protein
VATVDVKCPQPPNVLLGKMKLSGEKPRVNADNLLELDCKQCRKDLRREDPSIARVLHEFDFAGRFIRTEVVRVAATSDADTSAQRVTSP